MTRRDMPIIIALLIITACFITIAVVNWDGPRPLPTPKTHRVHIRQCPIEEGGCWVTITKRV